MRSRPFVSLLALAGALCAVPGASAATLSVDDDGQDCPAAAFATLQDAVDGAAAGDTVAICPGTYAEGSGAAGTNALTVSRSVTIKGAGADLVRISPRRSTASGGQIANDALDIHDGVGDIVAVNGSPAFPITVDISGVTIDGDGVYVEAGVVYRDARGRIARSRVTDVVTTEAADAFATTAGGWRGAQPGYGIAQVTAANAAPPGATPRTLTIDNVRVDRYNAAGVYVEGLASGGAALVDNRAVVNASEVVGRVLCQNFAADGDCSAPGLVTTGPLFGQDGVRVTRRARATVQSSMLTQNLVNGTGAPVRQSFDTNGVETNPGTTGNTNLREGAGIRLVDADAADSLIAANNIVDNAYGVYNAEADNLTPSAVAVPAPRNWWGLRFTPPPVNNGPAISPLANPPIPENPVNGAPTAAPGGATTSSAVDFLPFRSGPQSDPVSGQYPNIQAPSPVSDAAPTVTLTAAPVTVERGQAITLSATADDDFGVKRVTFYDGATPLGSVSTPPYAKALTVPADAPCAPRTFTALVEDSLGQSASAGTTATVTGPNGCRPATDSSPPTGSLPDDLNSIRQSGELITVTPTSAAGVAKVEFLLGHRLVCTVTAAPFSCRIVPRAAEIGLQSLRVVITDRNGLTTVLSRQVLIGRFVSPGVTLKLEKAHLPRRRVRRTITAAIRPPAGVAPAEACSDGHVTVVVNRRRRAFLNTQPRLEPSCTVRIRFTARRSRKRIYQVSARFGGNTVMLPISKTRRFS